MVSVLQSSVDFLPGCQSDTLAFGGRPHEVALGELDGSRRRKAATRRLTSERSQRTGSQAFMVKRTEVRSRIL